jgi:NAD(P)-dependent dehydrogenase (short-subunit alcohol dehydrogenase family)
MIDTPFSKSLMENKDFMEKRLAFTPLRRVGFVEEIAGVAVMLASKAGGFYYGSKYLSRWWNYYQRWKLKCGSGDSNSIRKKY